jgi:hypothetical protein
MVSGRGGARGDGGGVRAGDVALSHSRAYRAILTEAGHLGQTFCLVATTRGLAPFCAFRDWELDALLGLDGVRKSAMDVVGVGTRPKGRVANPGKIPARGPYGAG